MDKPINVLIKGFTTQLPLLREVILLFDSTDASKYLDEEGRSPAIKIPVGKKNLFGTVKKPRWDFFIYKTPEYYVVDISAFVPEEEIENG